ncbi:MAG TPA: acyl-CoA dehydrogenase family protein [Streptosporangiaceae bacterium]|nr:acyl-CoA dehydrogenase family protein [Streptosporangiaceae bacterium]
MDFSFTPEEEQFRKEVRAFAERNLAPHYAADDRAARMRPELPAQLAAMGLTGLRVPEELGGQGASAVTAGLATEEVGRANFSACYLIVNSALVAEILLSVGTAAQQERWLRLIAEEGSVPAVLLTEPEHGSDAASLTVRAERDGAGWKLYGEKTSVSLGMYATWGVVFARTGGPGPHGVSAFAVELDGGHVSRSPFDDLGNRSVGRASVYFDGLPVPGDGLLGSEGQGFTEVMRGFDYSRALIGLACLGTASAALDDALAYARQRTAFGAPIGSFQGVAFPLAEYATYLKAARHLCYEALWRKDSHLDHTAEANMAKWWAPRLSMEIVHQALLTFGHAGYAAENPQGQRLRDVIGLEIGDGTAQIAKLVVARKLLGRAFAP